MKILIAGRTGQVAAELLRTRWPAGTEAIALGRPQLDITDAASVAAAVATHRPDLIINAAAYTRVDDAEHEPNVAFAVNADGPRHLAREAARHGARLIHLSTDYVFGDAIRRPLREDDPVAPVGVYAKSKWAGDLAIGDETDRFVIVRTSWVFAAHGHNFVRTMLRLANKPSLSIVNDQTGCPTPAADLARAIGTIALREGASGTYHHCGAGAVTWLEFAQQIFVASGLARVPRLCPVSTAEYGPPAPRPSYSVLDVEKIRRDYGIEQRPWRDGLDHVLAELRTMADRGDAA